MWNVKLLNTTQNKDLTGINRNIVECKGELSEGFWNNFRVLIETLWNVKEYISVEYPDLLSVLIETLWNVKLLFLGSCEQDFFVLIETLWNVKTGLLTDN